MDQTLRRFKLINVGVSLAIIVACGWIIWQRQAIVDWWRLQNYQPPADIVKLADETTMIGQGRTFFFASMPAVEGRELFNQHCDNNHEHTIVLGCYRAQQIYLFDVTDVRLHGVEEVTAAHEMLHAAYERLDANERGRVDTLLAEQMKHIDSPRILDIVARYRDADASQLPNEMHSILGTEYRGLSAELEAYYAQYFADRQKVVSYSEVYESIFSASVARIAEFDSQLAELKQQINTNNQQLQNEQLQLQAEAQKLNELQENRDFNTYNAAVPGYNQKVNNYNALIAETRQLVEQYNSLIEQHNREAAAQDDLRQSLDSRYDTVPTE